MRSKLRTNTGYVPATVPKPRYPPRPTPHRRRTARRCPATRAGPGSRRARWETLIGGGGKGAALRRCHGGGGRRCRSVRRAVVEAFGACTAVLVPHSSPVTPAPQRRDSLQGQAGDSASKAV